MCEAILTHVRYDTQDESGETRREKYERFDTLVPPLEIPDAGRYLWDWYLEVAQSTARVSEGVCHAISATALKDWADIMGHIVYPIEYGILRAMDVVFCREMNKEFKDYRERTAPKKE